ncbi:MAG: VWA domain-containing protein [Rikenellaceae bacterium]|nr:VWA domain-containing protein [Rikenellaceae bacterium]
MYTQSITRQHRTAFVLLVDGSGSMAEEIPFRGIRTSKAKAVSIIANELLFELIERARRTEGIRDYYDIALWGYSGDNEVRSLLEGEDEIVSIEELAARPVTMVRQTIDLRLPDGSCALREVQTPEWIKPQAAGQTPMVEALRVARDLLARWIAREEHRFSFPPIVFNITDGEATDGTDEELLSVARQLRDLHTDDGNVLLINIHIGTGDERTLFFPSHDEPLPLNRHAMTLYEASSEMPACFNEAIRAVKGAGAMPPFRGMSFNASAAELVAMLDIGSISVKTE